MCSWLQRLVEMAKLIWARDHLLAGCLSFSLFVFLAWTCAVFNDHHKFSTLSEMVHDWNTAEGKIFIPALLLPAIFFLLSQYPYELSNASVMDHPYGHVFLVMRHFFVNIGLVLVAFVPTLDTVETRAHDIEVWIHSFAATLCFVSFTVAELFVLTEHKELTQAELAWRSRSIAFMCACMVLLVGHKTLYSFHIVGAYSEAWTFRYEMFLGGSLVSTNQLVWYFSDPEPSPLKDQGFKVLAAVPYVGCAFVIITDFFSRKNPYGLSWMIFEALLVFVSYQICLSCIGSLRAKRQPGRDEQAAGYGATQDAA